MRGLVTAFPKMRLGLSLSYNGRRLSPATKRVTGIPLAEIQSPPMRERIVGCRLSGGLRLLRDAPHKTNKLSRNCGADDGRLFAACSERAISGCQAGLCFPRDLFYARRRGFDFVELLFSDPGLMAVGPGAFDKQMSHAAIAGLGDRATPNCVPSLGVRPR